MEQRRTAEGVVLTRSRYETEPGVLTPRQRQIVGMFCRGMTYKEIAAELQLSPGSINPFLKQAARRMGASGIARGTLLKVATATGNYDG